MGILYFASSPVFSFLLLFFLSETKISCIGGGCPGVLLWSDHRYTVATCIAWTNGKTG